MIHCNMIDDDNNVNIIGLVFETYSSFASDLSVGNAIQTMINTIVIKIKIAIVNAKAKTLVFFEFLIDLIIKITQRIMLQKLKL